MRFMSPLLVVKDMERAKAFYREVLGANVLVDMGANATLEGPFALQTEESWCAFTGQQPDQLQYKANTAELYFEEADLDAFLQRLEQKQVAYLHEVREMPWAQRCVRFYDPDGHIIEVGEPMDAVCKRLVEQGVPLEEIARRTMVPLEVLQQHMPQK